MKNMVTTTEIMEFLREHMVTKEDIKDFVTKDELQNQFQEFKSDIISSIDRFAKLHETLDQELVSLRNKYDRLEGRLEIVEDKLGVTV